MLKLTKEEIKAYVELKLNSETIIEAKKIGNTIAIQGLVGQEVISLEIDKDGNEYIERTSKVSLDPKTKEPGWILTKTGIDNKPVVNKYGHYNQYIVSDGEFKTMYEPSVDGPNLYKKSKIEKFIQTEENIAFETKYGEMFISKGGYIKVSDLNRISGISEQSFKDTYIIVNPAVKTKK